MCSSPRSFDLNIFLTVLMDQFTGYTEEEKTQLCDVSWNKIKSHPLNNLFNLKG